MGDDDAVTGSGTPTTGGDADTRTTTGGDGLTDGAPAPAPSGTETGMVPPSATGTDSPATLVPEVIEVYFQVYPGKTTREGTAIGIPNAPYQLTPAGGGPVQHHTTDNNGMIRLAIFVGDTIRIRIFDTDFNLRARTTLEPVTERRGMQRRLQMMGFQLGPRGVDGQMGHWTERAILDFQADSNLRLTGRAERRTRDQITSNDWVGE
jgi:hypothetical protein